MSITPKFSQLALDILNDRYLRKDEKGNVTETPEQMLHRVASCIANMEKTVENKIHWEEEFYEIMARLDFLPNSPTLMNAGRPEPHGQLAACFVVDVDDNMPSICEALRKQMLIHKTGGGTGFNFSKLRPKNAIVNSTNGKASGPVSFMRLFDLSTEVVQQGGMRRGANMAILNADHKDIKEFIACKDNNGQITNFNLSVGITDDFMKKACNNQDSKEAALLYDIAEHAWRSGDPGVVFLDAINRDNPCPELGRITATNPCGESPLLPDEACNLGSLNLSHYYNTETRVFDWNKFKKDIYTAVRMLDNIIDAGQYPLPEIAKSVRRTRKIGLGVMGFADLLYKMHVPYDSDAAEYTASTIMATLQNWAHQASEQLGDEKGTPEACRNLRRRNATVICIAPTGTLAILADCSSGIEPVFALAYTRTITKTDGTQETVDILHPAFAELVDDKEITDVGLKRICQTSYDIDPFDHVYMQSVFQKHTDLAVSKTVNMPAASTATAILHIYLEAWRLGCKGITIYRDGSKGEQVLTADSHGLPIPKCTTC